MSRLLRTRGARSFGHENSAPLVAQNHAPSIDLFRSRCSVVRLGGRVGRRKKKIYRVDDADPYDADRCVNNLIFTREKYVERRRKRPREREEQDVATLSGLMERVLIHDTFNGIPEGNSNDRLLDGCPSGRRILEDALPRGLCPRFIYRGIFLFRKSA